MIAIGCENISLSFGGETVLDGVGFSLGEGGRLGIVGVNGAGKTSLLRVITGEYTPDSGSVYIARDHTLGVLSQHPTLDPERTVYEEVLSVFSGLIADEERLEELRIQTEAGDTEAADRYAAALRRFDDGGGRTYRSRCRSMLLRFGFDDGMMQVRCSALSGGQKTRLALVRLLLEEPDIMLLDEPTNHLDAESIDWLEQHLNQYEGTVIAVTHDRYFLDDVAGWILELDRGEGIPWKGNYSSWLDQKSKRMAQEEKAASKRRKTLERELEWVRMAPKARQAKGKARLNSYDRLLNEDQKEKEQHLEIFIPNGPRLGNNVIEAQGISKSFGEKVLYKDLTFTLPPAGIIGVIGPNGVGKTTLFRLIMGLETPDSGTFSIGETVKLAYVDQQHKDIDPTKSVYEVVSQGNELMRMGGREINARAYLSRFNFAGADQEKKCGVLSGGERNRLQLALALKQEGNVLLLDEPTNDIDVNTLRALEEGLEAFAGCAVVISHDRWFLDRICTHILAFEGDGNVFFFDGNYSDYEVNKAKRLGIEEPKRIRYRKFDEQ